MTTRQQVVSLLSGYSVEVTPASAALVTNFSAHLPAGATVNVTFLPGSDIRDTVVTCARLQHEGFNPVPHIAARSLTSQEHLERYLDQLASEAGIREVLVIGGGATRQAGPYASTMQVLESGLLERYGITRVGVAGHPEGTRDIARPGLYRALAEKNAWARDTGVDVYIETQFCFDAAVILAWERRIRRDGNRLPIHLGLPGLATLKTLLKFAQMSGVGTSIRFLTRQANNITRLLVVQKPDIVIAKLAEAVSSDPDSLIRKVHFYPFGGLEKTTTWLNAAVAGEIDLRADGGFAILQNEPLKIAS